MLQKNRGESKILATKKSSKIRVWEFLRVHLFRENEVILYVKFIIQQKYSNWQTFELFFFLFYQYTTEKSLNAFYYACSYAKVDYSGFMCTTVRMALKIIPKHISYHPVFLCIDDTMVPKIGTKFENVSKLYDHAKHNGSFHLNGHCFVSLMICVPVWKNRKISYLSIPLGYKMWDKTKSKILLAAEMVCYVMPELSE